MLQLSQEKLVDTERVQQTELTRSLAQEVQFFEANLTQQLISERQILALTGLIENVEDSVAEPKVTRLLENFVDSNRNTFIYLTAVGRDGKGTSASQGNFRAEQDPFVAKALQRAFASCVQSVKFRSDPLALAPDNRPAFVIAVPLKDLARQFHGNAGGGGFARSDFAPLAGCQRARPDSFRRGSLRAHRGASGYQEFCSGRGFDRQVASGGADQGTAEGIAQHRDDAFHGKRKESQHGNGRDLQHFSGSELGGGGATQPGRGARRRRV